MLFNHGQNYLELKAECSSHHAENTSLYMRLNPRGLTPSETGMDDRYGDEKGQKPGSSDVGVNYPLTC